MRKELSTGLGLLAVAALFGVLWLASDAALMRAGTVLFALLGLCFVAYALLTPSRVE